MKLKREDFYYFLKIVGLSILYIFIARFGLTFDAVNNFATLVWFPSGIAVAALILLGLRLFPAITFGAFVTNFFAGASLFVALGIGIGNTAEALFIAYLLRMFNFRLSLERLKDVLLLLFLTILGAAISASTGVISLLLGHTISFDSIFNTWIAWWSGDTMGILIITPFLLTWGAQGTPKFTLKKSLELTAFSLVLFAICYLIFGETFKMSIHAAQLTYIFFPPLIWSALRLGQRVTTTAVFLVSIFSIWGTTHGFGPFVAGHLLDRLFLLHSFLSVIDISVIILAAVVSEKRELEKRKDEFISVASHELKTPITSLKIYTQLLMKKNEKPSKAILTRMNIQTDKLTRLVDDLLNLSTIHAGTLEYTYELVDINLLVKQIIEMIQTNTDTHKITLHGRVVKRVYVDKDRIGQVLINLLVNAIKYSPQAHRVIVELTENAKSISVSIKDFGIGVEKEHRNKIFDRFYKVTGPIERTFPGLGIGLYISNEIIKSHKGEIIVEKNHPKGSIFKVTLPIPKKSYIKLPYISNK